VVKAFNVTGTGTPAPRRSVVDMAKCNNCHEKLMAHGSNRSHVDACVVCHNPTLVADGEPFSFQVMIHKIHTGEELTREYLGFNEVLYPGDRRDCLQCHKAGTYTVPLPTGTTAVDDPSAFWTPMLPTAAACLGCHDSVDAAAHAFVNTAMSEKFSAEACAVCHKESADIAVSKAHAR
jgi:OmcA/MtrC family decaheme c-type cytochrome